MSGAVVLVPQSLRRVVVAMLAVVLALFTVVRVVDHARRPQEEVAAIVAYAVEQGVDTIFVNRGVGHVTFRAAVDRAGRDLRVIDSSSVAEDKLCAAVAVGTAAYVDYPYEREGISEEPPACVGEPDLVLDQRLGPGSIAIHNH